jgi:hypothetical protein
MPRDHGWTSLRTAPVLAVPLLFKLYSIRDLAAVVRRALATTPPRPIGDLFALTTELTGLSRRDVDDGCLRN